MSLNKGYSVTRVPDNDWNNLMETVTLDGSYSEQIKNEVWSALERMEDFSNPWVVIIVKSDRMVAEIFHDEKQARKHVEKVKRKSPRGQVLCMPARYKSSARIVDAQ